MRIFQLVSILIVIIVGSLYAFHKKTDIQTIEGQIFNTYYKIKLRSPKNPKNLPTQIEEALEEVNRQMSVFVADSEISKINQANADKSIALSKPLSYVLQTSAKINSESGGAFDPTISPLIDLWGFGRGHKFQNPTDEQINEVLEYSNFNKLTFSSDYSSLIKKDSRTGINLSAIAKGYAVDKIASTLEEYQINNYIVEIGGEVRVSGNKDNKGNLWTIGLGVPLANSKANAFTMDITDISVATSGDYRNFIEQNGKRFSHTISPKTGKPVVNNLASVTVLATTCIEADGYATAIMSMGYEKGLEMSEKLNLPVIFFLHNNGNFDLKTSSAAKELIGIENETN